MFEFSNTNNVTLCIQVQFEDGSAAKVKRENVYVTGEDMPKKVSSRLVSSCG